MNYEFYEDESPLTEKEKNILAIGASIFVFLFFIVIGFILSWEPIYNTIGMFTFFWTWRIAIHLSGTMAASFFKMKPIHVVIYLACIVIMCMSILYELLILFEK